MFLNTDDVIEHAAQQQRLVHLIMANVYCGTCKNFPKVLQTLVTLTFKDLGPEAESWGVAEQLDKMIGEVPAEPAKDAELDTLYSMYVILPICRFAKKQNERIYLLRCVHHYLVSSPLHHIARDPMSREMATH